MKDHNDCIQKLEKLGYYPDWTLTENQLFDDRGHGLRIKYCPGCGEELE